MKAKVTFPSEIVGVIATGSSPSIKLQAYSKDSSPRSAKANVWSPSFSSRKISIVLFNSISVRVTFTIQESSKTTEPQVYVALILVTPTPSLVTVPSADTLAISSSSETKDTVAPSGSSVSPFNKLVKA